MSMIDAIREIREYMDTGYSTILFFKPRVIHFWVFGNKLTDWNRATDHKYSLTVTLDGDIPKTYTDKFLEAYTEL